MGGGSGDCSGGSSCSVGEPPSCSGYCPCRPVSGVTAARCALCMGGGVPVCSWNAACCPLSAPPASPSSATRASGGSGWPRLNAGGRKLRPLLMGGPKPALPKPASNWACASHTNTASDRRVAVPVLHHQKTPQEGLTCISRQRDDPERHDDSRSPHTWQRPGQTARDNVAFTEGVAAGHGSPVIGQEAAKGEGSSPPGCLRRCVPF